jgi:Dolichyl-phosphate-mannose-protein mannosyltransferase
MPSASSELQKPVFSGAPWPVQFCAWIGGLLACIVAMLGGVAEWDHGLATVQLLILAVAPALFMLQSRRRAASVPEEPREKRRVVDHLLALVVGAASFGVSTGIGSSLENLPPAYHDEYSYLFQAKTLLAGRFSFPSHPTHPELFDQMHVLNEGRMASRYYPGTGLWLAPFVALGHPYWGQWLAGAVASVLIFWTGRELGGRMTGLVAGLAMAVSPGIALFGNTLLAHHPTLLALSIFLFGMIRWRRTRSGADALLAGCGLSYAMLCRPMTAAGVGLPFGIDVLIWCLKRDATAHSANATSDLATPNPAHRRIPVLVGLGVPLVLGGAVILAYNHAVTGEWLRSPYQLYTDVYTPRHVYGFDNVTRGEQRLGPKVIEGYDRWAENLTPSLAVRNAAIRWIASWLWTCDPMILLVTTIIVLGIATRLDRRWLLIAASILSLHAVHVPYWYVGIMGWHYVFESAPLWCLLLAAAMGSLFSEWKSERRVAMPAWWCCLLGVSVTGIYFAPENLWRPRIADGISSLAYPRHQHAEFRQWLEAQITSRPALVLLQQGETEKSHLDLMVNEPGLHADLLLGRYRPGITDEANVLRDFPTRTIYLAAPERRTIRRIER